MKKFTIQALIDKYWLDIVELKLLDPQRGSASPCELEYQIDYAISYLDKRDEHACSLSLPIQLIIRKRSDYTCWKFTN
jgi:serine/threonine-protein kinase HipA